MPSLQELLPVLRGTPFLLKIGIVVLINVLAWWILWGKTGIQTSEKPQTSKSSTSEVVMVESKAQNEQGTQINIGTNSGHIGQIAGTINNYGSPNAATKQDIAEVLDILKSVSQPPPNEDELLKRYPLGYVIYGLRTFRTGGVPYSTGSGPKKIEIDWVTATLEKRNGGRLFVIPPAIEILEGAESNRRIPAEMDDSLPTLIKISSIGKGIFRGMGIEIAPGERKKVRILSTDKLSMVLEVLASTKDGAVAVIGFY